jgi:hypothetical protein
MASAKARLAAAALPLHRYVVARTPVAEPAQPAILGRQICQRLAGQVDGGDLAASTGELGPDRRDLAA